MKKIQITVLGIGKMGSQIAKRLQTAGFNVNGWNLTSDPIEEFGKLGIFISTKIEDVASIDESISRIFWLMIPQENVDDFLTGKLSDYLRAGDIIIDGGNSFYKDSIRRAEQLEKNRVTFFDCGTSGGISGEKNGFALMVGGPKEYWLEIEPLIKSLSSGDNYAYLGASGAGHFTKMVHNGIEYGMMESIAEGYAILEASPYHLNLNDVTKTYQKGSVISSRLIDLCADIFRTENINNTIGIIDATGEGEWTLKVAKELNIDARVIEDSFHIRQESHNLENQNKFSNKIVSLLRKHFGGHSTYLK